MQKGSKVGKNGSRVGKVLNNGLIIAQKCPKEGKSTQIVVGNAQKFGKYKLT